MSVYLLECEAYGREIKWAALHSNTIITRMKIFIIAQQISFFLFYFCYPVVIIKIQTFQRHSTQPNLF